MTPVLEAWVPVILYTALIFTLSSIPHLKPPGSMPNEDKFAHVTEYFFWGLLLRRAFQRLPGAGRFRAAAALPVLLGAGLCFLDESFQRTVGRNYSYFDMAADVTGVTLAQLAWRFLDRAP